MRFQVEAPAMQAAIEAASLPIRRGHIPILECLHIVAQDSLLRIVGTNMDMEAQARCPASVSEPGTATVNAADLARAIKGCKDIITAHMDGDRLRIDMKGASVALLTLPDEFPKMAKPSEEDEVGGVGDALRKLAPFAESGQSARQHLAGVCLDDGSAVATNGARLARLSIEGGGGQVVPSSAFPAILKTIGDDGRFFVGERTWRAEAESQVLTGKLVDLAFPAWRRIQIDRDVALSFDADAMLAALTRATLGRARIVLITTQDGEMTLSGENWDGTQAEAKATIPCDGADVQFVAYPHDLSDCLKVFAGSVVEASFTPHAYRLNTPEHPEDYTMISAVADARNALPNSQAAA